MKRLLFAAAALGMLALPAHANFIADLGPDPTSATGNFSGSLGTLVGTFDNEFTFSLDHAMTLTIASVTNVFPGGTTSSNFIGNFTAEVVSGTIAMPGSVVLGPDTATMGCGAIVNCQSIAGSAVLSAGSYFLELTGFANGSSGYGGNIATAAVPGPTVGSGAAGLLAGLGLLGFFGMRRQKTI